MNMIESRPDVMLGKPVVAGTRINLENILDRLPAGETIVGITEEHPRLTQQAVLVAIEFAAQAQRSDVVYPVTGHGPCCMKLLADENLDCNVIQ